jgi:hypothetical protein
MNVIKYLLVSAVLYGAIFFSSCNDPSIIGASLLDDDLINVKYVDTSTLIMRTIKVDSVRTYTPASPLFNYILGDLNDPIFGETQSSLYTQFNVGFNNAVPSSSLVDGIIDSAVLVLRYNESGFYGEASSLHTLTVHEVTEDLGIKDTLYSNMGFSFDASPIGEIQFIPKMDSITLVPHGEPDTTIQFGPQIRVPISDIFARQMLDTSLWVNDTIFADRFKGLHIQSNSSGGSFFGTDLSAASNESELNRLMVYVTDDTLSFDIQFDLRGIRTTEFIHDYSGSIVESFIENEEMGDSLIFIQGMSGVEFEMDLSYIRDFKDVLINKVELEYVTAEIMEDDTSIYEPIDNIMLSRINDEGNIVLIEDAGFAINNLNLEALFGGFLEDEFIDGFMVRKYTMNITAEVLSILADETRGTNLIISPFIKSERPNRSVIFGPMHSTYPARLKITFTEP